MACGICGFIGIVAEHEPKDCPLRSWKARNEYLKQQKEKN